MTHGILRSLSMGLACLALSCSDLGTNGPGSSTHPIPPLSGVEQAVANSSNAFGLNLFRELDKASNGEDLMVSPLSVSMALGMTLNGAEGSTRDAMEQTLGFTGMGSDQINGTYAGLISSLTTADPTVKMEIGNSIWYRPLLQVEQAFKDVNISFFNAQIRSIDFSSPAAAGIINGWVSDATHGKIPSIVPDPVPSDIVMYLINAVYFKGSWMHRFDSTLTYDGIFHLTDGGTVPARLMMTTDSLPYVQSNGLQVVDLPYGSEGFSMTLLLPPSGTSIDAFVSSLTSEKWESLVGQMMRTQVRVLLPKFKLSYFANLNATLSNLGMGIAFTDGANFTGIDRRGSLAISEVLHKSFIQVDEEGTEAAAVTSVGIRATAVEGGATIPVVLLDRPFIYVIRERTTGVILFVGKLAEPKWVE